MYVQWQNPRYTSATTFWRFTLFNPFSFCFFVYVNRPKKCIRLQKHFIQQPEREKMSNEKKLSTKNAQERSNGEKNEYPQITGCVWGRKSVDEWDYLQ